jgi:hypothetical protein
MAVKLLMAHPNRREIKGSEACGAERQPPPLRRTSLAQWVSPGNRLSNSRGWRGERFGLNWVKGLILGAGGDIIVGRSSEVMFQCLFVKPSDYSPFYSP